MSDSYEEMKARAELAESMRDEAVKQSNRDLQARRDADGRRSDRQVLVASWCAAAFGSDHASSLPQRGIRLAEEAIEAAQAAGCDADMVHKLVDYVYARPVGELGQELGGVGITLLALANAAGLSAEGEEAREFSRIMDKPLHHFTARNAAKDAAGFDATARRSVPADVLAARAERDLAEHAERWADEYGADLVPAGADTYGNGVRYCKGIVKRMVCEHATPTTMSVALDRVEDQLAELSKARDVQRDANITALSDLTQAYEQLSAMTAARDELADLANEYAISIWARAGGGSEEMLTRIAELRAVPS